jgi:hypothetical protein
MNFFSVYIYANVFFTGLGYVHFYRPVAEDKNARIHASVPSVNGVGAEAFSKPRR